MHTSCTCTCVQDIHKHLNIVACIYYVWFRDNKTPDEYWWRSYVIIVLNQDGKSRIYILSISRCICVTINNNNYPCFSYYRHMPSYVTHDTPDVLSCGLAASKHENRTQCCLNSGRWTNIKKTPHQRLVFAGFLVGAYKHHAMRVQMCREWSVLS